MTALDASFSVRVGDFGLDVQVDAGAGDVVAVVGPNGSGKTTLVRALAGLQPIDTGSIVLDGRMLDAPADGVYVPPEQRAVGIVFQDYLLFPRMSALDNVAFGLRAQGRRRAEARAAAMAWLERFGLGDQAGRRPDALSGGQAQRVALARALATGPALLLLDEPLAALDASSRAHVRAELRHHLASYGGVRILVTHDPIDALVLADRLVILERGRVVQRGTPSEVAARPANRYVADLVGLNLLYGTLVDPHTVRFPTGGELTVAPPEGIDGDEVAVAIRPQAIALHSERPTGSPRNAWQARIVDIETDHDRARVTLGGPVPVTAEVTVEAVRALALATGQQVWASVKAVDVSVYEA